MDELKQFEICRNYFWHKQAKLWAEYHELVRNENETREALRKILNVPDQDSLEYFVSQRVKPEDRQRCFCGENSGHKI